MISVDTIDAVNRTLAQRMHEGIAAGAQTERRIGAELKFPFVAADGSVAPREALEALWQHLADARWQTVTDKTTGSVIGATTPGEQNDTLASCETGYCKPEFSLAHVAGLSDLEASVHALRETLAPFCERHGVRFLGYGIQPVTPPSDQLLMKGKSRTNVWDRCFGANRCLDPANGDDLCLFTVNAASHVHVSVGLEDAVHAVNALNGFAGAQIALTAHSNIWRGELDPTYKCVAEKFWDWWMPDHRRVGVPERPFESLRDYVEAINEFAPVYVKRGGHPLILESYDTFAEYLSSDEATAIDPKGEQVPVTPHSADADLHSTCYWHNARITRFHTVENRANDQQPPEDLMCIAALTLGLVGAAAEAGEALAEYPWDVLRRSRDAACRDGLDGSVDGLQMSELAGKMLDVARRGLTRRGLGEQRYLEPLERRLAESVCPADTAAELYHTGGVEALVAARSL